MPEIEQTTTELTQEEVALLVADAPAADPSAFVPTDAGGVDWVLGKMADARARAARIRENADIMARACEREAEHLEWRFGAALQDFARRELDGGKRKSIRLYNGVLGYRTRPAGVHVTDDAAALAWAQENCTEAAVLRLDKKALSAALLETSESVPFAEFQAAEDVFYIK